LFLIFSLLSFPPLFLNASSHEVLFRLFSSQAQHRA
jgi:hypothetical protein